MEVLVVINIVEKKCIVVCLPTQRYDTPYGQVGEKLISIIAVELGGILDQKWNAEQVIVFQ